MHAKTTHSGNPKIIVPEFEANELNPPSPVRHAKTAKQHANNKAPKRSSNLLVFSEQLAVKNPQ